LFDNQFLIELLKEGAPVSALNGQSKCSLGEF